MGLMASEHLIFPEEYIPDVARIIRNGLDICDPTVAHDLDLLLRSQVAELEDYWEGLQSSKESDR
jgi:hypothetical protein